ncbi:hypothetical protein [Paucisalibacillus globulus]|uniref:hypothetical protein n=1 Tax=Paucisalibacillus globulus TaxID=351095 RepID=UPI00040A6CED|nr:hypothetical protein [Paucisalibacillus globulus]
MDKDRDNNPMNKKDEQLEQYRHKNTGPGKEMTDDTGAKVSNDQTSLRAGKRSTCQRFHSLW